MAGKISKGELGVIMGIISGGTDSYQRTDYDDDASYSNACYTKAIVALNMYREGSVDMIDDAADSILKACKYDKEGVEKYEAAVTILLELNNRNSENPAQNTRNASKAKIIRRAIMFGRRAIKLGSMSAATFTGVGEAYHLNNEPERAVKYLKHALRIDPANTEAKITMAAAMTSIMNTGDRPPAQYYKDALGYIDSAIQSGRRTRLALTVKADLLAMFSDRKTLARTLHQLKKYDPTLAKDWMWRGELYLIAGDKMGAEHYISTAKKLDPSVSLINDPKRYD